MTNQSKYNIQTPSLPVARGRLIPPGTIYQYDRLTWRTIKYSVIIITCPFCGKEHRHTGEHVTGPDGQPVLTRHAHCGKGEYLLEVGEGNS